MTAGNSTSNLSPEKDDLINATNIHVGIASQLFAASLVLIGVLLAFFDAKQLELASWPGVLTVLSITALIISLVVGGIGLKRIRESGMRGDWSLDGKHIWFRCQTLLNISAIICFCILFFINPEAKSNEVRQIEETNFLLKKIIESDSLNRIENKHITNEIDSLKAVIDELKKMKSKDSTNLKPTHK